MVRILSIWLPQLPLDRLIRRADPRIYGAFSITADIKNATRLTHVNSHGYKAGLTPGLSIPDARAICPDLLTEPCDPHREAQLLRALWRWADQLSPRVALDAPDGLLLDISGCAHLFGGEEAMGNEVRTRLMDMQFISRIGIADTKAAARAMAQYDKNKVSISPAGKTYNALQKLPPEALNISPQLAGELARSGLKTIGQLYQIKSSELARRFGLHLTKAINASTGQTPDPLTPADADPVYAARMTLPEPVGYVTDLEEIIKRLGQSVCARLTETQKGARCFTLIVRCVDTGEHYLSVGFTKPCFEVGPILQQFSRPLEQLKIEFGADWFRLEALNIEPIRLRQTKFGDVSNAEDNFAQAVSTIGNRIGFDHVHQFHARESHLPNREFLLREAIDQKQKPVWKNTPRRRPLRLYNRPEYLRPIKPGRPPIQFEWRRNCYQTKSAKGPERLTAEWWRDTDMRVRDYWTVQTTQGPRFWLLTYPSQTPAQWFVAGKFP